MNKELEKYGDNLEKYLGRLSKENLILASFYYLLLGLLLALATLLLVWLVAVFGKLNIIIAYSVVMFITLWGFTAFAIKYLTHDQLGSFKAAIRRAIKVADSSDDRRIQKHLDKLRLIMKDLNHD